MAMSLTIRQIASWQRCTPPRAPLTFAYDKLLQLTPDKGYRILRELLVEIIAVGSNMMVCVAIGCYRNGTVGTEGIVDNLRQSIHNNKVSPRPSGADAALLRHLHPML